MVVTLRLAHGADQSFDVARIGDQHAPPAHHCKGEQVRRQREDVIERQRRQHAPLLFCQIRRDHGAALQSVRDQITVVRIAPFGTPVVPPVYCNKAGDDDAGCASA